MAETFLTLPFGYPVARYVQPVYLRAGPAEMEKGFVAWVSSIAKLTAGEVVAIDGKTLCARARTGKKQLVHMVSAWAEGNAWCLGSAKSMKNPTRSRPFPSC